MAQTIAITNHKGGVGKTSITVNLAYALAMNNKNVLVLDLDPQAHSTDILCGDNSNLNPQGYIGELFDSKPTQNLIKTLVIQSGAHDRIKLAPSNFNLANVEVAFKFPNAYRFLKRQIDYVKSQFDFILLDCPPSIRSVCTSGAIHAADSVIIPCDYSNLSLTGVRDLLEMIKSIKIEEGEEVLCRIIRNKYDKRNKRTVGFIEKELEAVGSLLFKTRIRESQEINQASCLLKTVQSFNQGGRGEQDFQELAQEVMLF
jgi:chromosome partitioning protein